MVLHGRAFKDINSKLGVRSIETEEDSMTGFMVHVVTLIAAF
jgi:hypothetical protein